MQSLLFPLKQPTVAQNYYCCSALNNDGIKSFLYYTLSNFTRNKCDNCKMYTEFGHYTNHLFNLITLKSVINKMWMFHYGIQVFHTFIYINFHSVYSYSGSKFKIENYSFKQLV